MNIYNWFYVFNVDEFNALGLVSRNYTFLLDGKGQLDFLVTKGANLGITHDDVFLPLLMNDENPFEIDDLAIYVNDENNVFIGFKVVDEN